MSPPTFSEDPSDPDISLKIGDREILIRDRYETASIINDTLIAIEFFIGSIWFFFADHDPGIWLFVIGSAQLLARPAIRLARRVTLNRMEHEQGAAAVRGRGHEDPEDF
ncbi:YrhK family protein [Pseudonocardia phyllosphaerae]|uniref:YrhK family protein n=1 Tax=Pseudonocardia phyllosphaerae TaxID=3390502 RepID=UPI00397DF20A